MLTQPETKDSKPKDPKEVLKGLAPVSSQVLDDYYWGKIFGRVEGKEIVWKHGNPWLYPANEFEQLKTIILATFAADEFRRKMIKNTPADIAAALGIPEAQKAQAKKLSQGMADFFRGPTV